ncbi:conserved hypothetical protein [Candidatus Sulfopaludibacter sp. SbA3]|nr:conserved hypothetical protein [Candidatus Sulfopaludibacter sp. SbA3]
MLSMGRLSRGLLYFRLIRELLRYDLIEAIAGFRGIRRGFRPGEFNRESTSLELEAEVCDALNRCIPFYWKLVPCLQRSVVTVRVLRIYGAHAEVVIGYRLAPFMAHAWVEAGGRMVNDSPAFQSRLQVLERL